MSDCRAHFSCADSCRLSGRPGYPAAGEGHSKDEQLQLRRSLRSHQNQSAKVRQPPACWGICWNVPSVFSAFLPLFPNFSGAGSWLEDSVHWYCVMLKRRLMSTGLWTESKLLQVSVERSTPIFIKQDKLYQSWPDAVPACVQARAAETRVPSQTVQRSHRNRKKRKGSSQSWRSGSADAAGWGFKYLWPVLEGVSRTNTVFRRWF